MTERTENPPVQTTPRLPLRNLIGQWNSLHSSPETEADSMMNFQTFESNHGELEGKLRILQGIFWTHVTYNNPNFFQQMCVFLKVFLILDTPNNTVASSDSPFGWRKPSTSTKVSPPELMDMIGTWLFPTGSNKQQLIGFIFVPKKIRSNLAFCMDHTQQTSICLGYPIPNPSKTPANSQGNSLKCTNLGNSSPPSRPLLKVSKNCPHGKLWEVL